MLLAWPDPGHVGLRVVDYLRKKLRARGFAKIRPYDFSVAPWVSVKDGLMDRLEFMKNEFYYWKDAKGSSDLILFRSEYPAVNIYDYVCLVLDVASEFGVKRLYTASSFGAAGITHREEPVVLGVGNRVGLKATMEKYGIKPYPEYKGVGNIQSAFLWLAKKRDIEALSLWSPVPYYIARLPFPWSNYPKCSLAMLQKLVAMEKIRVDIGDLEMFARQTESEMAKMYEDLYEGTKSDIAHPIAELPPGYTDDEGEPISDEDLKRIIRDLDDFFRRGKQ